MVNTKITDLGGRKIALSPFPEIKLGALGDGTSKPGDLVYINTSGKAVYATTALFNGIVDDDPTIAENTAIADGAPLTIIKPKSGHVYRVKMADQGAGRAVGANMVLANGTGAITYQGDTTLDILAQLNTAVVDDDTVCELTWS
jgi:hypothetical protein